MPRKETDLVMIAVDGSKPSLVAARKGVELARQLGARVEFVYVIDYGTASAAGPASAYWYAALPSLREGARSVLSQAVRDAEELRVPHDAKILEGHDAAVAIVHEAEDANPELLVVGSHGRTGIKRILLGSVAEKVVRLAPCPVLVVR